MIKSDYLSADTRTYRRPGRLGKARKRDWKIKVNRKQEKLLAYINNYDICLMKLKYVAIILISAAGFGIITITRSVK